MKKWLYTGAVALVMLAPVAATPAMANQAHQEEQDGCDHGATGKDCKEDPSEHGKDCEVHGNHGGINEDHCKELVPSDTTSTTYLPTTTTTVTSGSTTSTTTVETPASSLVPSGPVESDVFTGTSQESLSTPLVLTNLPTNGTELPRTGSSTQSLVILGATVLVVGLTLRRLGRFDG